jgi:POT family proton-dependent oligopeptide transporter
MSWALPSKNKPEVSMNSRETKTAVFPATFWTANTIELFERGAYYAMASFVVIYLKESLGMSPTFATFLNGSLLWGLIYFLPIVSGTLADKYGFKRSLIVAFIMLSLGYLVMGNVQSFWPAGSNYAIPVLLGIVLIGLGGSIVKPCIAGTVQKTSGLHATLGFGIFYMVINIGSISGRGVSYFVRSRLGIPAIFFPVAFAFAIVGLLIVFFIYREPEYVADGKKDGQVAAKKTLSQALLGIVTVLRNWKFVFFLVVIGMFWILYVQLYNLVPLFLRWIDPQAPVELYTLVNPIMIVSLQLLITRLAKKWTPVRSIIFGVLVTTIGMLINMLAPMLFADISLKVALLRIGNFHIILPIAGLFLIVSIASMALGEMFASPRIYEYIGAIAPKGQEGLYLGYANLPVALGSIVGAPMGGRLFEIFISDPIKNGLPAKPVVMWLIVAVMGVLSMIGLALYDKFLLHKKQDGMA